MLLGQQSLSRASISSSDNRRARSWMMPRAMKKSSGVTIGVEGAVAADPHLGRVADALLLELEGRAVVDVVADVLLVGQHLVDGAARPGAAQVGDDALGVQVGGDLRFAFALAA